MNCTVTRRLPGGAEKKLLAFFDPVRVFDQSRPATPDELRGLASDAEVLIVTVADKVDEGVLAAAKDLKCLVTFSVGLDHIDLEAVRKRNLPLAHTPDVLTNATADLTFALILSGARRLKPAARLVEEGRWAGFDPSLYLGLELHGATLLVVGLGKIGQAVARRAVSFGMRVLYAGPEKMHPGFSADRVTLEQGLAAADVVSLHCPLKPETKHLIGLKQLTLMKPGAVLVNTARGPLVDEAALTAHLRAHPEFFAGLDVFEAEPHIKAGLASLPNAYCLPHIGSATRTAREAMARVCVEEASRFVNGQPLKYRWGGAQ